MLDKALTRLKTLVARENRTIRNLAAQFILKILNWHNIVSDTRKRICWLIHQTDFTKFNFVDAHDNWDAIFDIC